MYLTLAFTPGMLLGATVSQGELIMTKTYDGSCEVKTFHHKSSNTLYTGVVSASEAEPIVANIELGHFHGLWSRYWELGGELMQTSIFDKGIIRSSTYYWEDGSLEKELVYTSCDMAIYKEYNWGGTLYATGEIDFSCKNKSCYLKKAKDCFKDGEKYEGKYTIPGDDQFPAKILECNIPIVWIPGE